MHSPLPLVKHPLLYDLLGLVLAALLFALDSLTPLGIAGGFPYVVLVFIGLAAHSQRAVWLFAGLSTLLTLSGYFLAPEPVAPVNPVLVSRVTTVLAIWVTASLASLYLHSVLTLKPLAERDPLTGTYNRHYLLEKAREQLQLRRRYPLPLSLILLDIDHFKKINDEYGHGAGDHVLQQVARRLQAHTRQVDIVCRYGGEEFLILLPMVDLDEALTTAQRIQQTLAATGVPWESTIFKPTVSMGVAELGDGPKEIEALIAQADKALYQAKSAGRNQIVAMPK